MRLLNISWMAVSLLLASAAQAQTLSNVVVEPSNAKVGEAVKVTVNLAVEGGATNCGLRIHFGDGVTQDFKVNQAKDVPAVFTHTYTKAGQYQVMAEGKTVGLLKCLGKNQSATVNVAAPAATTTIASAAPAKSSTAPSCPEGWKLNTKSVNKKTGAYVCNAKPGTSVATKPVCPGDLTYFENTKKGQLGCRP